MHHYSFFFSSKLLPIISFIAKASPLIARSGMAAAAYGGRYSIQAWQAFKARPPTARLRRFYDGGSQPAMTRREAALIPGIKESTPTEKS